MALKKSFLYFYTMFIFKEVSAKMTCEFEKVRD